MADKFLTDLKVLRHQLTRPDRVKVGTGHAARCTARDDAGQRCKGMHKHFGGHTFGVPKGHVERIVKRGGRKTSGIEPKVRGMTVAKLADGYAFEATSPNARNDDWEIVVVGSEERQTAEWIGNKTIDGSRCNLFRDNSNSRRFWAQAT